MDKRLFLVDAFALIFRAYYSMIRTPRVTSYGKNTNAQFGFTNSLIDLINKEKPTHIAVCFDSIEKTERHEDFSDYKANREAPPEDLTNAIPDIKEIIEGFDIPIIAIPGYEADDIIGGLAKQAEKQGYEVYMVTPDKDFGQLVSEHIFIYKPAARGEGPIKMGIPEVLAKWDIQRIDQVVDMLGLMGDAADNIPGIKGVGEKTACKLLKEYDTLENVLDHASEIKGKLGEKIMEGKEDAIMSKKVATIITDIPYEFDESAFLYTGPDKKMLDEVFQKLEFRSLGKRLLGDDFQITNQTQANQSAPTQGLLFDADDLPVNETIEIKSLIDMKVNYKLIKTIDEARDLILYLNNYTDITFDTETDGLDTSVALPVGMSFCVKQHEAYYVSLVEDNREDMIGLFRPFFQQENKIWIGHNIKFDILILRNINIKLSGKIYDSMLAHYIIDPSGKHNMDSLALKYLHYRTISITQLIGPKGKDQKNMRDLKPEHIKNYAAEDADITFQLAEKFKTLSGLEDLTTVIEQIECPLVPVLADMEYAGVRLDVDYLHDYSKLLESEIKHDEAKVYELAGETFNLSSPKQLGDILYDKMNLIEKPKKTKTGQYSTKEDELSKLKNTHEIIDYILDYRQLTKLKSTYVDSLPNLVSKKDNHLHTSYNQAIAVTGRLSSQNPNLQNIPIKTERGKEIRKAFLPSVGNTMMSADYSQIELRIVAYVSGDKTMIEAFHNGEDIHVATASKVFGVPEEDVTKEMRYKAKAVNFGIIYGQSAFGLSENLRISRSESREIIDNYFLQFPSIKDYMNRSIEEAKTKGYVTTLMGRKRWLADINSRNAVVRGIAERNAINSPIQGTAADMIKIAMINIHAKMKNEFQSKMILQVHDELVFDVVKGEEESLETMVRQEMSHALLLGEVPVLTEVGWGQNWLEAH